uniref:Uncharacterized protein n=1 Tax=Cacopsylla melanoneura TaxID=428564 RepID=A0A8D8VXB0_9HEMI
MGDCHTIFCFGLGTYLNVLTTLTSTHGLMVTALIKYIYQSILNKISTHWVQKCYMVQIALGLKQQNMLLQIGINYVTAYSNNKIKLIIKYNIITGCFKVPCTNLVPELGKNIRSIDNNKKNFKTCFQLVIFNFESTLYGQFFEVLFENIFL